MSVGRSLQHRARSMWRALHRVEVVAVVVAVVPIVSAIVRSVARHWLPMGDNALVEIRSRDVFTTSHFPLLGTWSSASLSAGKDLNHPGPLLFDLLAIPVRLFGGPVGVALGIGLVNIAAVALAAFASFRAAGRTASLVTTAVAATLAWTLGSVLLTDPWNPHVLVLPCLALLTLVWAIGCGCIELLPWLMATASLCLEVHLGYAYLVPSMFIVALVGAVVVYRRRWQADAATKAVDARLWRRSVVSTTVVMVVLWLQPLYEQFFGGGEGNISRIVSSTGGNEPTIGTRLAGRLVATVMVLPPWWGRSSFTGSVVYTPFDADGVTVTPQGLVSTLGAILALVALALVLVVLAVLAWRRRDRPTVVLIAVSATATVVALLSLAISPFGPLGLTPHQMRWLWSVSAFTTLAIALGAIGAGRAWWLQRSVGHVGSRRGVVPRFGLDGALVVLVALVSVLNMPFCAQAAGPATFQDQLPTGRSLAAQIERYHPSGAVVVTTNDLRFTEAYSTVVMSVLQREGVDFRVEDSGLVRQMGERRKADGHEVARLHLVEGRNAFDARPGAERVALAGPLSPAEVDELLAGEQAMIERFGTEGVVISPAGEVLIAEGRFGKTRDEIDSEIADATTFVHDGLAAEMIAADALILATADAQQFERTAALRRQVGITTVAVFAGPLDS